MASSYLLCHSIANPLASPSPSISPLSPLACAETPQTVAGSASPKIPPPLSPKTIQPRTNDYSGVTWARPSGRAFIRISFVKPVPGSSFPIVRELLVNSIAQVESILQSGPMNRYNAPINMRPPSWRTSYRQYTLYPLTSSRGRDAMTWGIFEQALNQVLDFMLSNMVGTGMFKVWDGRREVGSIIIAGVPFVPDRDDDDDDDDDVAGPSMFPGSSSAAGPSNMTELGYDGRAIG